MFDKMKKNMPAAIFTVGIIITGILFFFSRFLSASPFNYEHFLLTEHLCEIAMVVITECSAGAFAFKLCLTKS